MIFYKNTRSGEIFAYQSEEEKNQWGSADLIKMTDSEIYRHTNPPPTIPQQITRAQGKAALIQLGIWQSVIDYMEEISDPIDKDLARIALEDTANWTRDSPFLNKVSLYLGLTEPQVDDLFLQASKIHL